MTSAQATPGGRTQTIGWQSTFEKSVEMEAAITMFMQRLQHNKIDPTATGLWMSAGHDDGRDILLIAIGARVEANHGMGEVDYIMKTDQFHDLMRKVAAKAKSATVYQVKNTDLLVGMPHIVIQFIDDEAEGLPTVTVRLDILQVTLWIP